MEAIIIFAIATIINVTLSTIRALCTIKGGKWLSAITNAVCYGFYPFIVMLTAQGTVAIALNMGITAVVNFVCVWLIKYVEERARKDKLWLVKMTIKPPYFEAIKKDLSNVSIPFTYYNVEKYIVFDTYCETQKQTTFVIDLCKKYDGKVFATENKLNL